MAKIAIVLCLTLFVSFFTCGGQAQSLSIGNISVDLNNPYPCSSAVNGSMFLAGMTCYNGSVSGCPNGVASIRFIFGYIAPASPLGTIVIFPSGPGTTPAAYGGEEQYYAGTYQNQYAVVQIEWGSAWQDPRNGTGILSAACRPATFLNHIQNHFNPAGHMCAQGSSAGSAAIAYPMAWYGITLNAVELLSGPVFSKIDQGCRYPKGPDVTICGAGQYGCTTNTFPWNNNPIYVSPDNLAIDTWTEPLSGCAASSGQSNLAQWQAMSLVDGSSGGAVPNFNYPHTSLHAWLCSSYFPDSCVPPSCPNNSAAEGNYFYTKLTGSGTPNFKLTGTTYCVQEEGVTNGIDPDFLGSEGSEISSDMQANCRISH